MKILTSHRSPAVSRCAFTLVELLTVVAIVGILAAILLASLGRIRAAARTAACVTTLRQYGIAFNLYASDHEGIFPSGTHTTPKWFDELQPYMTVQGRDAQSRLGRCAELDSHFSEYADWFAEEKVNPQDRRGYQYNRYLRPNSALRPSIPRAAIRYPDRTYLLWEAVGIGAGSQDVTGYPGGSYYHPKYRHGGKMNLLMVSGAVVSRRGINDPDETVTDKSIPYEEGGINWSKNGQPFYRGNDEQ